jgi:hypothetical protein
LTAVSERVDRVRRLLGGVPGGYGNGYRWTLADHGDVDTMPSAVLAFLNDAGVIDRPTRSGLAPQAPQTTAELPARLSDVDGPVGRAVVVGVVPRTLAYHVAGRMSPVKARQIFDRLGVLLGRDTRWWSNTDLCGWNPTTGHTVDALVIAVGGGVLVAVLAVDDD